MAFIFSTSHLPEYKRPEDEEEEEDEQPMLRAGGVRAFSHLPEQAAEGVAKEVPAATRPMRAFQPQGALSAHEALRAAASAVGRSLGDRMPLLDPRRETKEYRPRFGDEPLLKGGAQLRILEDLAHPDERQEHPDLPHVRGAEPVHGFRQNGSLFQDPVSQEVCTSSCKSKATSRRSAKCCNDMEMSRRCRIFCNVASGLATQPWQTQQ